MSVLIDTILRPNELLPILKSSKRKPNNKTKYTVLKLLDHERCQNVINFNTFYSYFMTQ